MLQFPAGFHSGNYTLLATPHGAMILNIATVQRKATKLLAWFPVHDQIASSIREADLSKIQIYFNQSDQAKVLLEKLNCPFLKHVDRNSNKKVFTKKFPGK